MHHDGGLVERRAQALRELHRVVVGPEMHEEQARLLVQHVAVQGGDLDAVARSARMTGFTSSAVSTKSPVIAALPPPVGWKLMAVGRPSARPAELHAAFADRIAARHAELVDAAVILALDADDLVELRRVEIDRGRCSRGGVEAASC